MPLDDLVLALQRLVDRFVRRARRGCAPTATHRRLLVLQIDGLSRGVLEQALAERRMPFLGRMMERAGWRLHPMFVGLPSSTPAFQLAAMYGVRPDIPGFHYHDKRRREDIYFPRAGDAAYVEQAQAAGRRGILDGGASYGCVFTGGAAQNLFTFAIMKRPTGSGILSALSALLVLAWVAIKSTVITVVELVRAVLRLLADPVGEWRRGWKWLAIKIGLSVWVRELFTLAVARDIYAGVSTIYVNYLDYDVLSHAYGPRHPRALRALRRVDDSLKQIWRVCRRVPEHRYDLYVLSDHGQAHTKPFGELAGGRRFERVIFEDFLAQHELAHHEARPVGPERPAGRHRLASGIKAFRMGRAPGFFQRFFNYIEDGFPWVLGELKESREQDNVRVICAGPNAFIYFVDADQPLPIERIDERWPGLAEELSRSPGVGYVFVRGADGPVCFWRGKRYRLDAMHSGPFGGRADAPLVVASVRDLMAMPSAGDLVIYGIGAPSGHISYIAEAGAHAGPSPDELHTFVVAPPGADLPKPLNHPIQLYPYFARYLEVVERETAA
jgi:Type I phosphodiesterase / nucleotide pyrophosphatase